MRLSFMFIVLICLYSHSTKSQYQSFFGKTSTSWNSVGSGLELNMWTDSIAYEKDTLIAGQSYKKVNWWMAYPQNTYHRTTFFREDTTLGRLWHLSHIDSTEKLVVDLSLNLNDQFLDPKTNSVMLTVDSVYYMNSRKHVRFIGFWVTERLEFIEGVGSRAGIVYNDGISGSPVLLCQYKDGNVNFMINSPSYPGICNVSQLTDIDDPMDTKVSLFPNPTIGSVKIETQRARADLTVFVHDAIGRQLLVKKCAGGNGCEVNLSQFSSTLFIVTISDSNNHLIKREKILLK